MKRRLAAVAALILLAGLALAQTADDPIVIEESTEERVAGEAALLALAIPPLQLGAELGNACVCLCRQADPPNAEAWGYYQRSIVSACRWSGRICVVEGTLGTLGACTDSPAPLN